MIQVLIHCESTTVNSREQSEKEEYTSFIVLEHNVIMNLTN